MRTFVELVVEYPDTELCTYKEYKGKPYYSIKYIENGEIYVGYGTYNPKVLSQYLKEYFMPSAQPEQKHGHWIVTDIPSLTSTTQDVVTFTRQCRCSECGAMFGRESDNYCYNCGARMNIERR